MQQFDFNNSRYAKLFSSKDNINFLRTFLNTKGLLYTNYGWYLTQGRRASMPTPTDYDGAVKKLKSANIKNEIEAKEVTE